MKRFVIIAIAVFLISLVVILLVVRNKTVIMQGGEGTNFPYTWQEKSNGTVVVKLNGSYAPEYQWTVDNSDPSVIGVEAGSEEKKGEITYNINPLAQGTASITFSRMRETEVKIDASQYNYQ